METTLTGPFLYLLIAWATVTTIFLGLLMWRSLLASHEDDQIFLTASQEHLAQDQRVLVARIGSLTRPIAATGVLALLLLLAIAGMWLYEGMKSF